MNMDSHSGSERPSRTSSQRRRPSDVPQRRSPSSDQGNSYQGRYLNDPSRQSVNRRRRRRRRSRGSPKLLLLGAASVILLVVSLILLIHSCATRNPLVGRWSMDTMTSYVFYEGGTGALEVPRGRYTFTYTYEDDRLQIDFHDEKALDSSFEYEKDGNTLTLIGGNRDNKGTFVLHLQGG